MEELMTVLTLTELLRMTRAELLALFAVIAASLVELPEGSPERHNGEANLLKIRWALARGSHSL
jgi:hypothetical protein